MRTVTSQRDISLVLNYFQKFMRLYNTVNKRPFDGNCSNQLSLINDNNEYMVSVTLSTLYLAILTYNYVAGWNFYMDLCLDDFALQCSLDYPTPLGPRLVEIIKKSG